MLKSYITTDLVNGDGTKYGVAYLFFPLTPGYDSGDPSEFQNTSDDIWNQTMTREFDSYKEANEFSEEFQSDL